MNCTPHPSNNANVVLFFDANMPSPRECQSGCENDPNRLCLHRFGPLVWVCQRPLWVQRPGDLFDASPVKYNRLHDLELGQWCIASVRRRWRDAGGAIQKKRYILITHDEHFLADAKKEFFDKKRGDQTSVPVFDAESIGSGLGDQRVTLEIHCISVIDRDFDLRAVIQYANSII